MNHYLLQFEAWLKEEDKGEKTIRTYLSVLSKFIKWYEQTEGKQFQLQEVTAITIQDYRSFLMSALEQKPATINKAIATLKTFFSWAVDAGHSENNPAQKVKMKRVQQSYAPKWLTEQEQNRLLYTLETERNEFKQARDRAIVLTMLYAGLRVEEVSELKLNQIDIRQGKVTVVNGKGGKYRVVPMHNELKKALKSWLAHRDNSNKPFHQTSEFLFVSERAGQMTTRGIGFMIDIYLERCGLLERSEDGRKIEGQSSCHSLRHSFCKKLVNAGIPIQEVARLAGHDNIQTTMRYVEPSEHDLRKAIQAI